VEPVIPDELKGKDRTQGEAGLRGHLLGTGEKPRQADPVSQDEISNDDNDKDQGGGSSAYVPPDPKDDVQLQKALELLRGTATDAAFPPKPGELSAECAQMAKKSDTSAKAPKKVAN